MPEGMTQGKPSVRVKGTAFRSVIAAAGDLRGQQFVEAVKAKIPGEGGDAIRFGGVISSGWYPVSWFAALYGTIVEVSGDREFARAVGRVSTRNDAGTVLRVFFRVLSIQTLLGQANRVFKMFFDGCDAVIENVGPKHVIVRWSGCEGFDRNLWLDQLGGCEELFALHGGRGLSMQIIAGGNDGDSTMTMEGKWS